MSMDRLKSGAVAPEPPSSGELAVPQATVDCIQQLVLRMLMDIHVSVSTGTVQRFLALGMTQGQILHASQLSPGQMDDLAKSYARTVSRRSLNHGGIVCDFFELGALISRRTNEEELAEKYLRAGASNDLMSRLFGKRSTECSGLRQLLSIPAKKGRKSEPKNVDEAQMTIYSLYKLAMETTSCSRLSILQIHHETGFPLNYIHRVITDNNQFPL
ncbi:Protein of unknown function [Marinobacterium lutimaris]|uniref:Uncharacterized protein n=2 Tax=Marinobacterium lutimaris TaxID=568106 RepID=A0A1H6DXU2_9GAMM|nr:Protein of unknown function [Marinobacterium lutimaris]